jgi:hypothetical protein
MLAPGTKGDDNVSAMAERLLFFDRRRIRSGNASPFVPAVDQYKISSSLALIKFLLP